MDKHQWYKRAAFCFSNLFCGLTLSFEISDFGCCYTEPWTRQIWGLSQCSNLWIPTVRRDLTLTTCLSSSTYSKSKASFQTEDRSWGTIKGSNSVEKPKHPDLCEFSDSEKKMTQKMRFANRHCHIWLQQPPSLKVPDWQQPAMCSTKSAVGDYGKSPGEK